MQHPGNIASKVEPESGPSSGKHSRQTARIALYARLLLGDALSVLIGFSLVQTFRDDKWMTPNGISLLLIVLPLFLFIAGNNGAYSLRVLDRFSISAKLIIKSAIVTFLLVAALLFATQSAEQISRLGFAIAMTVMLISALTCRYIACRWVRTALGGKLFDELLIIDEAWPSVVDCRNVIDAAHNGLRPDLDDPAMVERFAQITGFYDRVVIACPADREQRWATLLKSGNAKGEILIGERRDLGILSIDHLGPLSTLVVSRGALSRADRVKKRLFDLVVAVPVLIFLAPLMVLVALVIKIDSPGPVFFRQPRLGLHNVPFRIYKFRSMRHERGDTKGLRSTGRDDDRVSPFGRFIRRTSIDEIPQLLNVVSGEMSIVGPRPHALGSRAEDQLFWQITHRYWERHALKPGITGLAQVRGLRGTTEKTSDLTNRLQADLEYLQDWSTWRDISILFATLKVLIHPNAY